MIPRLTSQVANFIRYPPFNSIVKQATITQSPQFTNLRRYCSSNSVIAHIEIVQTFQLTYCGWDVSGELI